MTMATEMKERGILFKTEMVEAILAGTKTQTRRIIKPQPSLHKNAKSDTIESIGQSVINSEYVLFENASACRCPYGFVGDRLWVKETYAYLDLGPDGSGYIYKASENGRDWEENDPTWKWKPSIFMPRAASRITLEITAIRAERLQDITAPDAIAEGVSSVAEYKALWESINGQGSWADNPLVWGITFNQLTK